jgi:hypothetical protein
MPVVTWLKQYVGQRFQWEAANGFSWLALTGAERNMVPDEFRTGGIACFEVPLIAAGRLARITAADVADLSVAATANGHKNIPTAWTPRGVNRYYYGPWMRNIMFLGGWPQRGDIVFFWASGVGYFAHAAVATGVGSEVISLGHFETGRDDSDKSRTLEILTIESIVDRQAQSRSHLRGFTAVYYGPGPW